MGERGPRPQPTAVKELRGNPGKRALNKREPQFDRAQVPTLPVWVKGEARREWLRVVKQLHAQGLLTAVDRAALVAYCVAYGRWVEAEKIVADKGAVLKTANGNLIQNPYLAVANRAMDNMRKLAQEFGMTPSARVTLPASAPKPLSEFELYLARKNRQAEQDAEDRASEREERAA